MSESSEYLQELKQRIELLKTQTEEAYKQVKLTPPSHPEWYTRVSFANNLSTNLKAAKTRLMFYGKRGDYHLPEIKLIGINNALI